MTPDHLALLAGNDVTAATTYSVSFEQDQSRWATLDALEAVPDAVAADALLQDRPTPRLFWRPG